MAAHSTKIYSRMTPIVSLKNEINQLVHFVEESEAASTSPDSTIYRLSILAAAEALNNHSNEELDFLSKKYDISRKLFALYDKEGRKSSDEQLSPQGLQIFAGLLYLRVLLSIDQSASKISQAKYINVCWKAFENIQLPDFLNAERGQLEYLQDQLFERLPVQSLHDKAQPDDTVTVAPKADWTSFKVLPIDVLFYEGPIARAYLEMLYSLRCKPRRIIQLIAKRDLVTKKPVGRFLPLFLRNKYSATVQTRKIHHWPKYYFRTHNALCMELFDQLGETLKIEKDTLAGTINLRPLEHYCDNILSFPLNYFKDPEFLEFIKQQNTSTYLFTGGGIIPKTFFGIKNTQFLHVHPGHLPDIRGADCLLWSVMLSDHPSATCFCMNAGIDTGNIVNAAFLPQIKLPADANNLDENMAYRLLYSFIDPWVRAVVLRDTLRLTGYLENIASTPQAIDAGTTFHFMHTNMRRKVIKKFITGSQ
jgi:hypothetical protein